MKKVILLFIATGIFLYCSKNDRVTGTADDVNSGGILGKLLTDGGEPIEDTVTVSLYAEDIENELKKITADEPEALKHMLSTDGSYQFDSLAPGMYHVEVTKDSIVIGGKEGIELERIDSKTVETKEIDITVVIIINQTFNIWTDESQQITINNFNMANGHIESSDSGYVLTTAESDTLIFEMEIDKDGETDTVLVRIIRNEDGTVTIEIIDNEDDVNIIITPGTGPATGFLNPIKIEIQKPGDINVESSFDTTEVPVKSD